MFRLQAGETIATAKTGCLAHLFARKSIKNVNVNGGIGELGKDR